MLLLLFVPHHEHEHDQGQGPGWNGLGQDDDQAARQTIYWRRGLVGWLVEASSSDKVTLQQGKVILARSRPTRLDLHTTLDGDGLVASHSQRGIVR